MSSSQPDPTQKPSASAAVRSYRTPMPRRLSLLFGVVLLAIVSAVMMGFAAVSFKFGWALGAFVMAMAAFMTALTVYVWRDFRGNWGLHVDLKDAAVHLDLPANRSLIHRLQAQRLTIPYADIATVVTRLEAYGSLGLVIMQRAYAVRRKTGDLIFLFEERGLGTPFRTSQFKGITTALADRAGVELSDLGMVEGRGGFLATWATHAPDWATHSLSPERQQQLWKRASATGSAAILTTTAVTSAWYGGLLTRRKH